MSLIRWKPKSKACCAPKDPFADFLDFEHPFLGLSLLPGFQGASAGYNYPAIDVNEEDNQVIIKADLPGLKKENISLSVDGSVLTIKGERKYEAKKDSKNCCSLERAYGVFQRSIDLGGTIDQGKVKAKYKDGVLEVVVPKSEAQKQKSIDIE